MQHISPEVMTESHHQQKKPFVWLGWGLEALWSPWESLKMARVLCRGRRAVDRFPIPTFQGPDPNSPRLLVIRAGQRPPPWFHIVRLRWREKLETWTWQNRRQQEGPEEEERVASKLTAFFKGRFGILFWPNSQDRNLPSLRKCNSRSRRDSRQYHSQKSRRFLHSLTQISKPELASTSVLESNRNIFNVLRTTAACISNPLFSFRLSSRSSLLSASRTAHPRRPVARVCR